MRLVPRSLFGRLVAILLGYFLGKEILAPRVMLAASLIIGSVVLVSVRRTP